MEHEDDRSIALPPEGGRALPPNSATPRDGIDCLPPEGERAPPLENENTSASENENASSSGDENNSASEEANSLSSEDENKSISGDESDSTSEGESDSSSQDEYNSLSEDEYTSFEDEDGLPLPPAANPTASVDLNFSGIDVKFPYQPYESQKLMMDRIIRGIRSGQNCLLESPTGTGKTAALLCASLAWLKNEMEQNEDSPALVIYASRTHSQLQQVASQLKKTAYSDIPMVTFASRNQTCINETAHVSGAVNAICEVMRENHSNPGARDYPEGSGKFPTCSFYANFKDSGAKFRQHLEAQAEATPSSSSSPARCMQPWDIEDLVKFGRQHNTCPYYEIKDMREGARLILCSYNHLLHPWIREAVKLTVDNNVIIFDEAHNIESTCMEIASRKISVKKFRSTIIPGLTEATERTDIPWQKREPLRNIEESFTELFQWLSWFENPRNRGRAFERLGGAEVMKISNPVATFSCIGFGPDEVKRLYKDLLILKDEHFKYGYDPLAAQFQVEGSAMHAINSILYTFHTLYELEDLKDYTVDVVARRIPNSIYFEVELSVLCLTPRVIFKSMQSARSVIVASGTLSPMESFPSELGMVFKQTLKAPHVVNEDRIFTSIISRQENGRRSVSFNFSYENLELTFDDQSPALANLLFLICEKIRKGVLVFFTSKRVAIKFKKQWKEDGTLKLLSKSKRLFFEHEIPANKFKDALDDYRSHATSEGAIMFAVLRGRISEGIDFADDQARAVITVGIPFGPIKDLLITRKKVYNDVMREKYPGRGYISGQNWYDFNAFRALNQALGRCLRHKEDWGALFIVDSRWDYRNLKIYLSDWAYSAVIRGDSFRQIEAKLKEFIRRFSTFSPPRKKVRPIRYSDESE